MSEQEVGAVGVNHACEELGGGMKEIRPRLEGEEGQVTWFVLF